MVGEWIPDGRRGGRYPVWTRAVAGELFPDPVLPLEHDLLLASAARPAWNDELAGVHGFGALELPGAEPSLLGFVDGHAYLNASLLRVWAGRMSPPAPEHLDTAYVGHHPDLPTHVVESWHEAGEEQHARATAWLEWVLGEDDRSALEVDHHVSITMRRGRPDPATANDGELLDRLMAAQRWSGRMFTNYLSQTLAASVGPVMLAAICHEIGEPGIYPRLVGGLGGIDTVAAAPALWTLSRLVRSSPTLADAFDEGPVGLLDRLRAESSLDGVAFLAGLDVLLAEVGFLGPAEWQLSTPSWESDPELVVTAIDWLRRCDITLDPSIGSAYRHADRTMLVKEVGDIVAGRRGMATRERFNAGAVASERFVRGRERARSSLSRLVNEMRVTVRELGERGVARSEIEHPDDLHLLFGEELRAYVAGGLGDVAGIVAERRRARDRVLADDPPFVVDGGGPPPRQTLLSALLGEVALMQEGEILLAEPASAGRSRGIARVVCDVGRSHRFDPGDIVVTGVAPASWLPYAIGTAALVVESGSVLSPTAVIGRELGVPVVVGAIDAMARIPDGAMVEVDGETGIVTLIDRGGTGIRAVSGGTARRR